VHELLSENKIKEYGIFDDKKIIRLITKCQKHKGSLLSERENMALVGILSTQLLNYHFIQNFPN
jgi:asparagine synthase (glutamine-hydrolysing)